MSKTILVVDDDPILLKLVQRILEGAGYHALLAESGPQALTYFQDEAPALVLLDIAMPEMNGYEVARAMREIEAEQQRSRIPIVVLTAFARNFSPSAGHETGVDSYLSKPITARELVEHIGRFLGDVE